MSSNREPLAVLHGLLSAGAFIEMYTDTDRLFEFVGAALQDVAGVKRCVVRPAGAAERDTAPAAVGYSIELKTLRKKYGEVVIEVSDSAEFEPFIAAAHNFCSAIGMRLENIEQQRILCGEIQDRTAELRTQQAFLQSIIDQSADLISVIDPDYTVMLANPAAEALWKASTSRPRAGERLSGTKCYASYFDRTAPCPGCPVLTALETRTAHCSYVATDSAVGSQRWYDVSASPVLDGTGGVQYLSEIGRDVTDLKWLRDDLERAVQHKDLLLREIHHRVKNNLAMAVSLLRLQFSDTDDPSVRDAVDASAQRIQSMSRVHEFLYQSDTIDRIDFRAFVEGTVEHLLETYGATENVRIVAEIADIPIDIETALPVSLIVTELVANSLKYAFPDGRAGTVRITTSAADGDAVELVVRDDGVGLPKGFQIMSAASLGMGLIQGLSHQIGGTLTIGTTGGASFRIVFPRRGS